MERERERERERKRDRDREREKEKERETETETERDRERGYLRLSICFVSTKIREMFQYYVDLQKLVHQAYA